MTGHALPPVSSGPASTATPASPTARPGNPLAAESRSPPVSRSSTAAMIGDAAMSRPVSELEMWRSASDSSSHAAMISKKAKTSTGLQYRSTGAHAARDRASGSSTAAPIAVRANTRTGTETPSTAILISRYGMPQMTLMAANKHPTAKAHARVSSA